MKYKGSKCSYPTSIRTKSAIIELCIQSLHIAVSNTNSTSSHITRLKMYIIKAILLASVMKRMQFVLVLFYLHFSSFSLTFLLTSARHNASSASGPPARSPLAGSNHVLWPQAYETSCSLAALRSYARHERFHHHPSHPRSADRLPTTAHREPDTDSHGESST